MTLLALMLIIWIIISKQEAPHQNTTIHAVKTQVVQAASATNPVEISAFVRGTDRADVAPLASGRILRIFKHEGEAVRKGEPLAILDANVTDAQSSAALSSVAALKKTLGDSKDYYDQLVSQAEAARDEVARSGGSTTLADEAVRSAKRARDLQVQNTNDQLINAQGVLEIASAGKRNYTVIAPFSGTITALFAREGGFANFSFPLVSIATPRSLEVEAYVNASESSAILVGQNAAFKTPSGQPLTGIVTTVAIGSDPQTLKTLLRIKLDVGASTVRLGDFIHGNIFTTRENQAVSIARSAILTRGGDAVVFTIDTENIAHEQRITIGKEYEGMVDVTEGLLEGQRIVTEGQRNLLNGLTVTQL